MLKNPHNNDDPWLLTDRLALHIQVQVHIYLSGHFLNSSVELVWIEVIHGGHLTISPKMQSVLQLGRFMDST